MYCFHLSRLQTSRLKNFVIFRMAADSLKMAKNLILDPSLLEWKGKIGSGGCGEVFHVIHKNWGPIAMKKLSPEFMDR